MNWETILCLGDSITFGARSYLGFPEYCAAALEVATNKDWNVINLAVSGFTVIELHRHLDTMGATFQNCKPEVINIMIGTNDLKEPTTLADFSIAYKALLVKVKVEYPNALIIVNEIPHLLPGVRLPYKLTMNKIVQTFNVIIREIAIAMGIKTIKFDFKEDDMFDGVHLNHRGAKRIGEILAQKIIALRHQI